VSTRLRLAFLAVAAAVAALTHSPPSRADTVASLLGNFTINQFCGLRVAQNSVDVHYVVVYGQLPALRELHNADANGDGVTSQAERDAYVGTLAPGFGEGLELRVDGVRMPFRPTHWTSSLPSEQGGFSLRVDVDFLAALPAAPGGAHSLVFTNNNYQDRLGWREIVVNPAAGVAVFETDAYDTSATGALTEALQALPEAGPLDERTVHMRLAVSGAAPQGASPPVAGVGAVPEGIWPSGTSPAAAAPGVAAPVGTPTVARSLGPRPQGGLPAIQRAAPPPADALATAENGWITAKTRSLVDAISGPTLDPRVALWALLGALLLGAVHALSPGHGKTIVGAYLIGSRGTPRHAVFLGLTVTLTHTIGVFVLGFATLYASKFIVPERLFPILSSISALLVLGMGLILLIQRGRAAARDFRGAAGGRAPLFVALEAAPPARSPRTGRLLQPHRHVPDHRAAHLHNHGGHVHSHGAGQLHDHPNDHVHGDGRAQGDGRVHTHDSTLHSHAGGPMHSHLPPGAAGERVTWKSLAALGVSGGLVPCPSAMVLLLAAVALNKTAYGMLLVLVFSLGLALTLTVVGLAFLYARNRFGNQTAAARWPQLLPVASAAMITLVGVALCVAAVRGFS
jgi:ABC-type nickel/cobalt efflux system permease component RcnA